MPNEESSKRYDLEDRTFAFAKAVRVFVRNLKRTICNIEDGRQLVSASGSVGANYIEANEALSKKDFRMRVRTSRKETKESRYWLRFIDTDGDAGQEKTRQELIREATELLRILSAILNKSE